VAKKTLDKWQYGDFQTPDELARKVVATLKQNHGLKPSVIIESSCGKGAFIRAADEGFNDSKILGFDINKDYVADAKASIAYRKNANTVSLQEADFFNTDWAKIIAEQSGYILIIGNPPWVTSSELGLLNSANLPEKSNFQNRRGIEAITGSGNFDISEWMLLQHVKWLSKREGAIALLCKYSVARKVMRQVRKESGLRFFGHIYPIDAKAYFGAAVEACLFVLTTDNGNTDYEVYKNLDSKKPSHVIGERAGLIVSDVTTYERWKHLSGQDARYVWRSGVKHDCAKVMELERLNEAYVNGLGESVYLENDYLYPLLKSSDLGNGRTCSYRKIVLITQKTVGEDTTIIQKNAPKTWQYLANHHKQLAKRKSSIYKNKPPYSIFGIGSYTFKNWKIAISGLYKKLLFNLIGPLDGKTVVFDDTVNFLSFDTEAEAKFVFSLITSKPSLEFLKSMIFWDEKRPITTDILRRVSLKFVANELEVLDQYLFWAEANQDTATGQLSLGISEHKPLYKAQKTVEK